jgi:hypothetical protein
MTGNDSHLAGGPRVPSPDDGDPAVAVVADAGPGDAGGRRGSRSVVDQATGTITPRPAVGQVARQGPMAYHVSGVFRWRLATWLVILWCAGMSAWILAASARLAICPFGAPHCDRRALYQTSTPLVWWSVAALVGVVALSALWWWDRRRERLTRPVSPRPVRLGILIAVSLPGVLAGTQLLLFAPMVDDPFCATPIRLGGSRAYPLNCDSPLFMRLAQHPSLILRPHELRQDRPVYVAIAAVLTRIFGPAAKAMGLDRAFGQSDSAYIPLVLINLVVLVGAVVVLAWLLARLGTPTVANAALCSLLIINDLTKAFFWTPHQQMFELLVPVAAIALARWILLARPSMLMVAGLGLVLGLASLIYGSALIAVLVVGLALLAWGRRGLALAALLCASFAIPTVGWIAYCDAFVGSYFNKEVSYFHEFIWLPEAAGQGLHSLFIWVQTNTVITAREFGSVTGVLLLVLAALAIAVVLTGIKLNTVSEEERQILLATVLTIGCSLIFTFGLGIIATRIMFDVLPAILVLAGWVSARLAASSRAAMWLVNLAIPLLALLYVGQVLTSYGPYS